MRIVFSMLLVVLIAGCIPDKAPMLQDGAALDSVVGGDAGETSPQDVVETEPVLVTHAIYEAMAVKTSICVGTELLEHHETLQALAFASPTHPEATSFLGCVVNAETCEDFLHCYGYDTSVSACDTNIVNRCILATAQQCDTIYDDLLTIQTTNCASPYSNGGLVDGMCVEVFDEFEGVTRPRCVTDTCSADESKCEGTVRSSCEDNLLEITDCAFLGLDCNELSTDFGVYAECVLPGLTCDDAPCFGTIAFGCDPGEENPHEGFDCAVLGDGYTCNPNPQESVCIREGATLECTDGQTTCEGDVAKVCFGITWVTYDCGTFMDGTCIKDEVSMKATCTSPSWPPTTTP